MAQSDRQINEKDRCSTCGGTGWKPWEGKWVVCRECIGTGRRDHKGRKRQKPDEAPAP